jgi:hypothetical protein
MECIVDIQVMDTDAPSYQTRNPTSVLKSQEKEISRNTLRLALSNAVTLPLLWSHASDVMMGCEASTFAKRLSAKLAEKWQKPYLQVCGYINNRLSIDIICATHLCAYKEAECQLTTSASNAHNGRMVLDKHCLGDNRWDDGGLQSKYICQAHVSQAGREMAETLLTGLWIYQ